MMSEIITNDAFNYFFTLFALLAVVMIVIVGAISFFRD